MPLLGSAAMLLSFDVAPEAVAEHDHWHTFEHLPERLGIPGFLRGTRWVAQEGSPRYVVLYEVAGLDTLTSEAYLARLNQPSPWTQRMMPHYRGMSRGFCSVTASVGLGTGQLARLWRFAPADAQAAVALRQWLVEVVMPSLPQRPGLGSAHMLEGARTPAMTHEQRLRGADAGVDWALMVTAHDEAALAALALDGPLTREQLAQQGAVKVVDATYRFHYALSHHELAAWPQSSAEALQR